MSGAGTCCICGKRMLGAHHLKRACSDECRKALRRWTRRLRLSQPERKCCVCGASLDGRAGPTKTCSAPCTREKDRLEARRRRRENASYREKAKEAAQRWREKNMDHVKAKSRKRYQEKRDQILQAAKDKYHNDQAHRTKVMARERRRYWKDPEKRRAAARRWREENLEFAREQERKRSERDRERRRQQSTAAYHRMRAAYEVVRDLAGKSLTKD